MKKSLLNIFSIIFAIIVMYYTFYSLYSNSQLNWWGEIFPYVQLLSTVLLMLTGIVFGSLFRQIGTKKRISIVNEIKHMWVSSSFWSAILVSPLVFSGVFLIGQDNPVQHSALFLAFQNGFFCESVFSTMLKQGPEA